MGDTIDLPKIGPVKKVPLFLIVGAGAAYVGWRWYSDRGSSADDAAVDDGFGEGEVLPTVPDAYTGQSVGIAGGDDSGDVSTGAYGFNGSTNSQWTQYAATQLSLTGTYDYAEILTDLGQYLAGAPLTSDQVRVVQAALAVAGYPPQGSHPIVSGGDATITIAPGGLSGHAIGPDAVSLQWNPVAGADGYRIYRSGVTQAVGEAFSTSGEVGGLTPNSSYSFQVAAHTSSGNIGPKSVSVTVKTSPLVLATPQTPTVSSITATTAQVTTKSVPGAESYLWYVNGVAHGHSDAPTYKVMGLKPKTKYTVTVDADTHTQSPGKQSAKATFTTKAK